MVYGNAGRGDPYRADRILQYKFSRERVTEELFLRKKKAQEAENQKTVSMKAQFAAVASEKWWWIVMVFYMIFQFSGAIKNGSMSYFCKWVLDNSAMGADAWGTYQSIFGCYGGDSHGGGNAFLSIRCAKSSEKRKTVSAFLVLGALGGVIAGFGGSNIVPVAVGVALKCLGSSPACYMILAMLADVY